MVHYFQEKTTIISVYAESRGISSNWIYHAIQKIFKSGILESLEESIPDEILKNIIYHHQNRPDLDMLPAKKKMLKWLGKDLLLKKYFFIQLDRQKKNI